MTEQWDKIPRTFKEDIFLKKGSKKIATGIAVAVVAAIASVTAFASSYNYDYNLKAGTQTREFPCWADNTYMYFNTRPQGTGGVSVTVKGPSIPGGEKTENFPSQVSRTPMKIDTYLNTEYYAVVTAGSTNVSGELNVWTSNS